MVVNDEWVAVLGRDPGDGSPCGLLHLHDAVGDRVCGEVTWVWDGESLARGPDVEPT